ncbi:MAG: type II toxin-antitoxin system VapC family toxin [Burkholderiaceae bacterium]
MAFVLDSSVALAWLLPDEGSEAVDKLADQIEAETIVVPAVWRLEVGNALLTALRRERLARKDVERLLALVAALPVEQDLPLDDAAYARVMAIAQRFGLTSYDAAYLELAKRRGVALATLDARLRQASAKAGVAVMP